MNKQMKEYNKKVKERIKNLKLTLIDIHNLYDLLEIADTDDVAMRATLKTNGLSDWFYKFKDKIWDVIDDE